jgi:hypothetical protein
MLFRKLLPTFWAGEDIFALVPKEDGVDQVEVVSGRQTFQLIGRSLNHRFPTIPFPTNKFTYPLFLDI